MLYADFDQTKYGSLIFQECILDTWFDIVKDVIIHWTGDDKYKLRPHKYNE